MTESAINGLGGPLLRSGRSGDYAALGEVGQPVYRVALQLREAIKRKLGNIEGDDNFNYADYLAVPQSDQLADKIDWYSNLPGDVIPWTSATEEERESARAQLRSFEAKLKIYGEELTAHLAKKQEQRSSSPNSLDQQVFIKLLTKVLYTPDADYVYLVNGKPVLTFWGFTQPNAKLPTDPLLPLFPVAKAIVPPPVVEPLPVVEEPVPVVVAKRPWWRRWWWLLPLLLLLLLLWLLFGLRSCNPQLAANLGLPDFSLDKPEISAPELPTLEIPKIRLPDGRWVAANSPEGIAAANAGMDGQGAAPEPSNPPEGAQPPETPETPNQPEPPKPEEPAVNPDQPNVEPPALPENPQQPPAIPTQPGQDLQIPPNAAQNGQADFLSGKWKAGAGIQDTNTGKPLRLEYNFDKGKGQVTVQRADGMRCTGDVDAQMKNGSLSIGSQGQAKCADGTSYEMPDISCAPGAKTAADCTGNYGNTRFPMSMRNAE